MRLLLPGWALLTQLFISPSLFPHSKSLLSCPTWTCPSLPATISLLALLATVALFFSSGSQISFSTAVAFSPFFWDHCPPRSFVPAQWANFPHPPLRWECHQMTYMGRCHRFPRPPYRHHLRFLYTLWLLIHSWNLSWWSAAPWIGSSHSQSQLRFSHPHLRYRHSSLCCWPSWTPPFASLLLQSSQELCQSLWKASHHQLLAVHFSLACQEGIEALGFLISLEPLTLKELFLPFSFLLISIWLASAMED